MSFGKFRLCGLRVVEPQQRHTQVVVSVREGWIQADGFAVIVHSFLKSPGIEKSGAAVEPDIGVVRLERNEFLVGCNCIAKLVSGQLAGAETGERIREIWLLLVGLLIVESRFCVILLRV